MRDTLTQKEWDMKAKVVVSATGPFTDMYAHMHVHICIHDVPCVLATKSGS